MGVILHPSTSTKLFLKGSTNRTIAGKQNIREYSGKTTSDVLPGSVMCLGLTFDTLDQELIQMHLMDQSKGAFHVSSDVFVKSMNGPRAANVESSAAAVGVFLLTISIVLSIVTERASSSATVGSHVSLGDITIITPPSSGDIELIAWAYAHPTDHRHLMACGMMEDPDDNVMAGYLYSSDDNGKTWRRAMLDNSSRWVSETNCLYGEHDKAYMVAGVSDIHNGIAQAQTGHLHLYESNDNGDTWHRTFVRSEGWIDWTYLADIPGTYPLSDRLVIFGNNATDRLGHWYPLRPVVIESENKRTFSGLITPHGKGRYQSTFASGSVVLPDGSALFGGNSTGTDVFAYSPRERTLKLRATIDSHGFAPSLAQDRSDGRFRGRLYAAWVVRPWGTGKSSIQLGTSDDGGLHWSIRTVMSGSEAFSSLTCRGKFDDVRVAVGRDGTLGILWPEDDRQLFFSFSRDGGRTFSPSAVVAAYTHSSGDRIQGIAPYNIYALAVESGASVKFDASPGLAVMMASEELIPGANALTADASGTFHALWSLPRVQGGGNALYTRSVEAGSDFVYAHEMLTDSNQASSCFSLVEVKHATSAASRGAELYGEREVTSKIAIQPLGARYDARSHTVKVDIAFINVGIAPLRGPLTLVATNMHSDIGSPIALDSRTTAGGQPMWRIDVLPVAGLQPRAQSRSIHLGFRVTDSRPLPQLAAGLDFSGVAMNFRIYEPNAVSPGGK